MDPKLMKTLVTIKVTISLILSFFIREMVRNLGKISIDNLLYLNRSLIWNGMIGTVLNTCNPYEWMPNNMCASSLKT